MSDLVGVVPAFEFLAAKQHATLPPVCVVFGDDEFLRRLAVERVARLAADEDPEAPPPSVFSGENLEWINVRDALATRSLFGGGRRLVRLEDMAAHFKASSEKDEEPGGAPAEPAAAPGRRGPKAPKLRGQLEAYAEAPLASGILLVVTASFASNLRLYKSVEKSGLAVDCRLPMPAGKKDGVDTAKVARWVAAWAAEAHRLKLAPAAAERLLDLTECRLGIVDQHLAKLALLAAPGEAITAEFVQEVVGGWKTKDMWGLIDAAVEGNAAEALRHVGKLLDSGEKPIALIGQLAWSLRRFQAAGRIVEQDLRSGKKFDAYSALQRAGFKEWPKGAMQRAESALKQLGRQRTGRFYRQLLALDLSLKGSHSNDERAREALELFFLSLDKGADPRKSTRPLLA